MPGGRHDHAVFHLMAIASYRRSVMASLLFFTAQALNEHQQTLWEQGLFIIS
jgi:hypothetical protein